MSATPFAMVAVTTRPSNMAPVKSNTMAICIAHAARRSPLLEREQFNQNHTSECQRFSTNQTVSGNVYVLFAVQNSSTFRVSN